MLQQVSRATGTLALACFLLCGGRLASAQEVASQTYRVKPSDVVIPADAKLGQYRRTIQPFENWTLICDENLKARRKVCNVSQIIEDQAGKMTFSWSLAATKDGKPYMILRTPPSAKSGGVMSLQFGGRSTPIDVRIDGCNEVVCVGMMQVGPAVREQIDKGALSEISYLTAAGAKITVNAPLNGLTTALRAIK